MSTFNDKTYRKLCAESTGVLRASCDTKVRCIHCTRPGDQHRATDGRCPKHDKFPAAPRMPATQAQLDAWDRKIAHHWNTETTFTPWVSAEGQR